jgi:hercynylcysteine S-oxide lyase
VLAVTYDHSRREATIGGYEAESGAAPQLDRGRAGIAALVGMAGRDVAFVPSASAALAMLLDVWPLEAGDEVACLPGEYGPSLTAFSQRRLRIRELPVDQLGRVDLDALGAHLASHPPALVHLTQVPSHRGIAQPAAEVCGVCRSRGIPLVVDAAQALGQVDAASGADVVYGTSRKWLSGPRGVGFVAVRPPTASKLRIPVDEGVDVRSEPSPVQWLERSEGHVAGRLGLSSAVDEVLAAGAAQVHERLAALGRLTRTALDGIGGWRVVEPYDEPTATTTLVAPTGVDVIGTRTRLRVAHGILTSGIDRARAPREMTEPVLRVSPHLGTTVADVQALATALQG